MRREILQKIVFPSDSSTRMDAGERSFYRESSEGKFSLIIELFLREKQNKKTIKDFKWHKINSERGTKKESYLNSRLLWWWKQARAQFLRNWSGITNSNRDSSKTKLALWDRKHNLLPLEMDIPFEIARLNRKANTWTLHTYCVLAYWDFNPRGGFCTREDSRDEGECEHGKAANASNNYLANEWAITNWNGCEVVKSRNKS